MSIHFVFDPNLTITFAKYAVWLKENFVFTLNRTSSWHPLFLFFSRLRSYFETTYVHRKPLIAAPIIAIIQALAKSVHKHRAFFWNNRVIPLNVYPVFYKSFEIFSEGPQDLTDEQNRRGWMF